MPNAADPKKIKDQALNEARAKDLLADSWRFVMSDERGRNVIAELLDFTGPLREAFNTNGSITNYALGQQSVGRKIFADVETFCPDLYLLMRQESRRKEEQKNG